MGAKHLAVISARFFSCPPPIIHQRRISGIYSLIDPTAQLPLFVQRLATFFPSLCGEELRTITGQERSRRRRSTAREAARVHLIGLDDDNAAILLELFQPWIALKVRGSSTTVASNRRLNQIESQFAADDGTVQKTKRYNYIKIRFC